MTREKLILIVSEIVKKYIYKILKSLLKSEQFKSIIRNIVIEELNKLYLNKNNKKSLTNFLFDDGDKKIGENKNNFIKKRTFTKDPILNEILNSTVPDIYDNDSVGLNDNLYKFISPGVNNSDINNSQLSDEYMILVKQQIKDKYGKDIVIESNNNSNNNQFVDTYSNLYVDDDEHVESNSDSVSLNNFNFINKNYSEFLDLVEEKSKKYRQTI